MYTTSHETCLIEIVGIDVCCTDSSMFCCSPKLEVLSEDVESSSEIGLRLANLMEGVLSVSAIPCACIQPTGLSRSEAECVQEWISSCFEENSLMDELRIDDGNSARLNKNDWLFRRHGHIFFSFSLSLSLCLIFVCGEF